MIRSVKAGVLNEDVEAVKKRTGGRASASFGWSDVRDDSLPLSLCRASPLSLSWKVTERTITVVTGRVVLRALLRP